MLDHFFDFWDVPDWLLLFRREYPDEASVFFIPDHTLLFGLRHLRVELLFDGREWLHFLAR